MATVDIRRSEKFEEALREFEEVVLSPVVPGELERWTEAAEKSTTELRSALGERLSADHKQVLKAIADADAELIPRVEKMRKEDDALAVQVNDVCEAAAQLHSIANEVEPEEDLFNDLMACFRTASEKLAIRVKKQEQAIRTWYQESLQRDRGPVD